MSYTVCYIQASTSAARANKLLPQIEICNSKHIVNLRTAQSATKHMQFLSEFQLSYSSKPNSFYPKVEEGNTSDEGRNPSLYTNIQTSMSCIPALRTHSDICIADYQLPNDAITK